MSAQEVNGSGKASTPLLREGELIGGRYKIERCLGGGGMASVYRATHVGLDQPVAVKVVSPLIREVPGIVSRFMREARAATRLKGEHIVRVFDVGATDDGAPYMVMELLQGRDLGELLDEGFRPTVEQAIDYVLQACEALAEVHGLGIVHRDLKPANLFVTRGPDGLTCIKLIDFGISRVDSPLSPKDSIALTNPEVVMGSPRYMPPEQMESAAAADSRSDIWGLGAILYELLVGHAPFDGESLFDIYAAAVRSPPPAPSSVRREVPKDLDDVLLKCLRVDPTDRHADVAELALALAPFGNEDASSRAESIARVLDASRARGQGVDDGVLAPPSDRNKSSSSSRIRRRASESRASRRRRVVGLTAAAMLLVGVGFVARPLARRLNPAPFDSENSAAAVIEEQPLDPPSTLVDVPGPSPAPAETTAADEQESAAADEQVTAAAAEQVTAEATAAAAPAEATATTSKATPTATPAATTPKSTTSKPAPRAHVSPRRSPAPARQPIATYTPPATPPAMTTSPPATPVETPASDLASEPAPPPRAPAPRGDDRTLFEERK